MKNFFFTLKVIPHLRRQVYWPPSFAKHCICARLWRFLWHSKFC